MELEQKFIDKVDYLSGTIAPNGVSYFVYSSDDRADLLIIKRIDKDGKVTLPITKRYLTREKLYDKLCSYIADIEAGTVGKFTVEVMWNDSPEYVPFGGWYDSLELAKSFGEGSINFVMMWAVVKKYRVLDGYGNVVYPQYDVPAITKYEVLKDDFIEWYFADKDDCNLLAEDVINMLREKGVAEINLQEIFDNCHHIPSSIVVNAKDKRSEYSPDECILIDKLK